MTITPQQEPFTSKDWLSSSAQKRKKPSEKTPCLRSGIVFQPAEVEDVSLAHLLCNGFSGRPSSLEALAISSGVPGDLNESQWASLPIWKLPGRHRVHRGGRRLSHPKDPS